MLERCTFRSIWVFLVFIQNNSGEINNNELSYLKQEKKIIRFIFFYSQIRGQNCIMAETFISYWLKELFSKLPLVYQENREPDTYAFCHLQYRFLDPRFLYSQRGTSFQILEFDIQSFFKKAFLTQRFIGEAFKKISL